jgi:uncharacterized protein (DUF58 family)
MTRSELLKKIAAFRIAMRNPAEDLFSGEAASLFRGRGLDFDQVRQYEAGDDVRSIDWNVSARFGKPFVKVYTEEREHVVFVLFDCSSSMFSSGKDRYEQALLALAAIAFSAERGNLPLGVLFFSSKIERAYRPRRGRKHIMEIIGTAMDYQNNAKGETALEEALTLAQRSLKKPALVVIISDFMASAWEGALRNLALRQDCAAIRIADHLDVEIPKGGLLFFHDSETGKVIPAFTSSQRFRQAWSDWNRGRVERWAASCARAGVSTLELSTSDDAVVCLRRFFRKR